MHPLVGLAEGTKAVFHFLHKRKDGAGLFLAGVAAHWAVRADRGQGLVKRAGILFFHVLGLVPYPQFVVRIR